MAVLKPRRVNHRLSVLKWRAVTRLPIGACGDFLGCRRFIHEQVRSILGCCVSLHVLRIHLRERGLTGDALTLREAGSVGLKGSTNSHQPWRSKTTLLPPSSRSTRSHNPIGGATGVDEAYDRDNSPNLAASIATKQGHGLLCEGIRSPGPGTTS
jgi:hypothetical protein